MQFRRAKIVCTLGPATSSPAMVDRLLRAGMDVARLNFSHGEHADHARHIAAVRAASGRYQKPVAILADLQGPKIRTGALEGGRPVRLRAGQQFIITTAPVAGNALRVSTTYKALPHEVRRNDRILLDDGRIELRVHDVRGREIRCEAVNGGELGEHKGINLPGVKLKVPAVTAKDRADLAFALAQGVNYVAVSFVRRAEDVRAARLAAARLQKKIPIIAKLEKPEAIDNLDSILRVADGVMVARGDLGVEMTLEMVPVVQKHVIARARDFRVPVITATQMLDSMTRSPRPTRAEASDVANAVFEGSDALMLSGETAVGRYPIEAVTMMERIICVAEASPHEFSEPAHIEELKIAETIAQAACYAAEEFKMKVLAVFTESGFSARLIATYRPPAPIVAFSRVQETRRQLSLVWGVRPRTIAPVRDIDSLTALAERRLLEEKLVRPGDVVGIVAGTPLAKPGTTNFLKLHRIGG